MSDIETNIEQSVELDNTAGAEETPEVAPETVDQVKGLELEELEFESYEEPRVNPLDAVRGVVRDELQANSSQSTIEDPEVEEDKPLTKKELQELLLQDRRQQQYEQARAQETQRQWNQSAEIAETHLDRVDENLTKAGIDLDSPFGTLLSQHSEAVLRNLISQRASQLRAAGQPMSPREMNNIAKIHWNQFKASIQGIDNLNFNPKPKSEQSLSPAGDVVTTRPERQNPETKKLLDYKEKAEKGELTPLELFDYRKMLKQIR